MRLLSIGVMCISLLLLAAVGATRPSHDALQQQVAATERAFAASMQQRDQAAFTDFLADEAIFMSGATTLRGHAAVAQGWQRYFVGAAAPFTWMPDRIEVVRSGTLAYTSGPVFNPAGKQIGRFHSIWRLEAPGRWKIVFDRSE